MGGRTWLVYGMVFLLLWSMLLLLECAPRSAEEKQEDPTGILSSSFSCSDVKSGGTSCDFNWKLRISNAISVHVNGTRLVEQINHLASFSDTPPPSVTRVIYSSNDVAARRYICNLMKSAGLSVREDAIGNIFGRWDGSENSREAIASGSHIDAIPYAGKYDGVVGVLGAIEAIRVLRSSGFKPRRSLEVIMFTSEEPTRFGLGCLGRFLALLFNDYQAI